MGPMDENIMGHPAAAHAMVQHPGHLHPANMNMNLNPMNLGHAHMAAAHTATAVHDMSGDPLGRKYTFPGAAATKLVDEHHLHQHHHHPGVGVPHPHQNNMTLNLVKSESLAPHHYLYGMDTGHPVTTAM